MRQALHTFARWLERKTAPRPPACTPPGWQTRILDQLQLRFMRELDRRRSCPLTQRAILIQASLINAGIPTETEGR